ncbi:MAG: D-alanyl-D-alanine carboxypeptidase, partial [Beijerinckiaceae bacterium]
MATIVFRCSRTIQLFWQSLLLAAALCLGGSARAAETIQTTALQAVLMDAESGTILYEKNGRSLMLPASLAKLMTAEILFHEIKEGRISLDQEFVIS